MTETRTVHDPFLDKDVEISDRLTDRLRGKYASGPTMPNGEPEFGWREFPVPAIQKQAADEIDRLAAMVDGPWLVWSNKYSAWWRPKSAGYTYDSRSAGLYSRDEAIEISWKGRDGWKDAGRRPDEIAVPLFAIPEAMRPKVEAATA